MEENLGNTFWEQIPPIRHSLLLRSKLIQRKKAKRKGLPVLWKWYLKKVFFHRSENRNGYNFVNGDCVLVS